MDVFSAVVENARAHLRDGATRAAGSLGIFPLLETPRTSEELARVLGLRSVHRLEALCEALAHEGILLRSSSTESSSPRFRMNGAVPPAPAIPLLGWGRLAEVICSDTPLPEPGVLGVPEGLGSDDPLNRFHSHLCNAGAQAAAELMTRLAALDSSGCKDLLDLGSGAGAYSRAWLAARSDTRATLLDRQAVLELAASALSEFKPRFELRSDDLASESQDRWPRAQMVLLANLLHLFGPQESQTIVNRAAAAVLPGGLVVIKDLLLEGDPPGPAAGIFFSLNMALFTERGRVHRKAALVDFLERAGLVEIEVTQLAIAPDAVVVQGRRPAERAGSDR